MAYARRYGGDNARIMLLAVNMCSTVYVSSHLLRLSRVTIGRGDKRAGDRRA